MADKPKRLPFHETFASKVIEQLKNGTAPWQQPWEDGQANMAPHNHASKTVYKGVNRVNLAFSGFSDPRWMTLKQANDADMRIKRGSKSSLVVFYQWTKEQDKLDEDGKPILDIDSKPEKETVRLDRPIFRTAYVFNGEQIDGMPPLSLTDIAHSWEPTEKAEKILQASNAIIKHDQSNRAFYRIGSDSIHLPPRENFPTPEGYYGTALHELGHWTRHPTRLHRENGPFGSEVYAREELRAEIASWMLAQDLGIPHDPGQHAAYVDSWIEAVENDPLEIIRACRDAEKIKEYLMGLELQKEKHVEVHIVDDLTEEISAKKCLEKTFLDVPYAEKNMAKSLGAKWDKQAKLWFAPQGTDLIPLEKWLPKKALTPLKTLSPQEDFAMTLAEKGLDLQGNVPVMNGEIQRVPLFDDKAGARSGAYAAYSDGVPSGWVQNFKTGEKAKWMATGHKLSAEQKITMHQECEQRITKRELQRKEECELAAKRSLTALNESFMASNDHPYLKSKGIPALDIYESPYGNTLLIPMRNVEGQIRGLQKINSYGEKRFEQGMEKKGCFHLVGGNAATINHGNEIILSEGYATGVSLHLATKVPVAVAFDVGNLEPVAQKLREHFPNVKITICADNDHTKKHNVGYEKAFAAAKSVGGHVRIPLFNEEELARGLTDFNDLHTSRGLKEVTKQLNKRNISKGREL